MVLTGVSLFALRVTHFYRKVRKAYILDHESSPKSSDCGMGICYLNLLSLFVNPFLTP